MARRMTVMLNSLIEKLGRLRDGTQPIIVMGDEDSINLTERQLGFIDGINAAIRLIEQTDPMSDPVSTGDQGQRYILKSKGYPNPGWQVVLYTKSLHNAQRAEVGILLAPGCEAAQVFDRRTNEDVPYNPYKTS